MCLAMKAITFTIEASYVWTSLNKTHSQNSSLIRFLVRSYVEKSEESQWIGTCSLVVNKLVCIFVGTLIGYFYIIYLNVGTYLKIYSHSLLEKYTLFAFGFLVCWKNQRDADTRYFFNSCTNDINIWFDILPFLETLFNILHFYGTYLCLYANFQHDSSTLPFSVAHFHIFI